MSQFYKNLIFTHHAYHRLKQRSISKEAIYQTIKYADYQKRSEESYKFIKSIDNRKIHVVANFKKQENKWLIISVWVRGEEDKLPIIWQLLTLPFRLIYLLLAKIANIIISHNKKK